ncbi:MAG TPA: peptide chain release factor N(5)-glutamine methyltransferase [Methylomirabilota bacterium]|nr:peptide chain release factor N(5)-glutamine methyltransferase [Methylomirabilota bacterium]
MTSTKALVSEGVDRLRALGFETPRLDSELLLAHAIGVERTAVVANGEAPVGPGAAATFRASLDRRAAGEPVAYIRGIKEFHGIALAVDRRALIPRPETEHVVDLVLAEVMARLAAGPRAGAGRDAGGGAADPLRVVDVGTGSGAIAIALAVALRARRVPLEEVSIDATDISPDALDLARENAVGHAVGDRVAFAQADLLPSPAAGGAWDVIAANLPYVRSGAMASLPTPTTFEPAGALDGGPDGLSVIERLLDALPAALDAGGAAFLEIGADQGEAIVALAAKCLPGWSCVVQTDLAGLPRTAIVRRDAS